MEKFQSSSFFIQTAAVGISYLFMSPLRYWHHFSKRSTMLRIKVKEVLAFQFWNQPPTTVYKQEMFFTFLFCILLHLTFSTLKDIVKSELTNRMFSGFRSVCVSLLSWRTMEGKTQIKKSVNELEATFTQAIF